MTERKRLRAAVIGCGFVGGLHARAILDSPHAVLQAVCDLDPRRTESWVTATGAAAFASWQEMFRSTRLDVVSVATPDHLHLDPVLSAIEQGVHVFCEKPLAGSLVEARRMARAAAERKVHLGVDYNRRLGFGYRQAKDLLAAETSGRLRQATIQVCDGIPASLAQHPYSLLTSLVSHHLDLLRWFGGEVRSLHATLSGPSVQHPRQATIVSESSQGVLGSVCASWREGQRRTVEQMQLIADNRVISVEDVQQEVCAWHESPDSAQRFRPNAFEHGNRFYDTVTAHLSAFLEAVANGNEPPVTGRDGCATLQLVEAAIESHRTGRRIDIPQAEVPEL